MPEPTTSAAAATLATSAVVVPVLSMLGVSLGLRADVLLAGFCGAVAAIALLNTVPAEGDTWRELLRTSLKRVGVALGSAVTAGYTAPLLALINGVPDALILSVSFISGAGAPHLLPWLITRVGRGGGVRGPSAAGDQQ